MEKMVSSLPFESKFIERDEWGRRCRGKRADT